MRFDARNLLCTFVYLAIVLVSIDCVSAHWFSNKKDEVGTDKAREEQEHKSTKANEYGDVMTGKSKNSNVEGAVPGQTLAKNLKQEPVVAADQSQTNRQLKRIDLSQVRQAAKQRELLEKNLVAANVRGPKHGARMGGANAALQVHGQAKQSGVGADTSAGDGDEGFDEGQRGDAYYSQTYFGEDDSGSSFYSDDSGADSDSDAQSSKNVNTRHDLSVKYISTMPKNGGNSVNSYIPTIVYQRVKKDDSGDKNKLISGKYWSKQFGKAYKTTKKGIVESAKVIAELPKVFGQYTKKVQAFMQLDSMGKILALTDQVKEQISFVRREFAQFTFTWSQIMEKALNYLGDQDLDKIKWNHKDPFDLRGDALHSLAFGYEFILMMIVWRENLLVAHEAFLAWMRGIKNGVEKKEVEVDNNLIQELGITHSYMLWASWLTIKNAFKEPKAKIEFMIEIHDRRLKNYESEFFRDFIVLKEMYAPTTEELEAESKSVERTISESGAATGGMGGADKFFDEFRDKLARHEITDVDWEVPKELSNFMDNLRPQLSKQAMCFSWAFMCTKAQAACASVCESLPHWHSYLKKIKSV